MCCGTPAHVPQGCCSHEFSSIVLQDKKIKDRTGALPPSAPTDTGLESACGTLFHVRQPCDNDAMLQQPCGTASTIVRASVYDQTIPQLFKHPVYFTLKMNTAHIATDVALIIFFMI